jgi:hypothetical protein
MNEASTSPETNRFRWLDSAAFVLGAGIFAAQVANATRGYAAGLGTWFFDWTFYSAAVERWLAGEPIYPDARISTLGSSAGESYAYPPASVPLMAPFASWPVGALAWETLIIAVLLVGVWLPLRAAWPARTRLAMGVVLVLMAFHDGVLQGIALGNVNILTAGMVGVVWTMTPSRVVGPGVLAVLKVFPLSLAAPFGLRTLVGALVVAAAICLATLPMVGLSSWMDYRHGLEASVPLCGDDRWVNYSLACVLVPLIGIGAAKGLTVLLAGALLALSLVLGPRMLGLGAATLAILVPATEVHGHYFAILFVFGVVLVSEWGIRTQRRGIERDGRIASIA